MSSSDKCASVNTSHDLNEILRIKDSVFALFYASWCPFCAKFLPIFNKNAENEQRYFILVQDDQEIIADKYSINAYPTVLYFENGVISNRLDGVMGVGLNEKQLADFVNSCSLSK